MTQLNHGTRITQRTVGAVLWLATVVLIVSSGLIATPVAANDRHAPKVCSRTATTQYQACRFEVLDDYYTSKAFCLNSQDSSECILEAYAEKREANDLCKQQRRARRETCEEIGQAAYDPDMDPALFQDPRNLQHPNPYYPLAIGNHAVFQDEDERIEITVLNETKRASGIDCLVVNDRVFKEGSLVEDTDDWFAVRTDGSIEYCGEDVKDYELFEGDDPMVPQLVSIEGSFKVGEERAKSGTAFLGAPITGAAYRQEWDPGNAEDNGKVLSTHYGYGNDPELDEFVPEALAELMCSDDDCVVIADTSSLDPDAFERKFYARGIGKFLEIKPDEGVAIPIVECNFDARCGSLPID